MKIYNRHKRLLIEEIERRFMTREELLLRKELVKLLIANNHPKFARRLAKFNVNIVELKDAPPDFVAAISYDEGTIYISRGLLADQETFNQLDVLMRHELAHNLLMHQVRLMRHLGDELGERFSSSATLHQFLNVIEDWDISNSGRYSDADKKIVKNLWVNGRLFPGLITELDKPGWEKLTLEEMYGALDRELQKIHKGVLARRKQDMSSAELAELEKQIARNDQIALRALPAYDMYANSTAKPSRASGSLKDFIDGKAYVFLGRDQYGKDHRLLFADLGPVRQKVLTELQSLIEAPNSSLMEEAGLEELIDKISQSGVAEKVDLTATDTDTDEVLTVNNKIPFVVSPEEKFLVLEFLKKLSPKVRKVAKVNVNVNKATHSQDYIAAYNEIIKTCDNNGVSDEDLEAILAELL